MALAPVVGGTSSKVSTLPAGRKGKTAPKPIHPPTPRSAIASPPTPSPVMGIAADLGTREGVNLLIRDVAVVDILVNTATDSLLKRSTLGTRLPNEQVSAPG